MGEHVITVTACDSAGHTSTATVGITVVSAYTFGGFEGPVVTAGPTSVKAGSTIALKWSISGPGVNAGTVTSARFLNGGASYSARSPNSPSGTYGSDGRPSVSTTLLTPSARTATGSVTCTSTEIRNRIIFILMRQSMTYQYDKNGTSRPRQTADLREDDGAACCSSRR